MNNIISYLFETNAIRFCKENQPFWYTSGKIGPYFINTHFIYGNEADAVNLLKYIDESLGDKETLPKKVFEKVYKQYQENEIYKNVINIMKKYIEENIDLNTIEYISGGERRDWFFSNILAHLLKKPHISIYKDLSTVISDSNFEKTENINKIEGNVLHIADLITVASSYIRAWIPAIEKLGGKLTASCVVVDRMQGGKEKIQEKGIKSLALVQVDKTLFKEALNIGIINENQEKMLESFFEDPDNTMRKFLINHPEFIENSLNSDEKTKKRAELLIEQNLYNLK